MSKLIKKSSKKAGLPPGTLVHIGEKKTEKTRITVVDYDGQGFQEKELETFETCYLFPKEHVAVEDRVADDEDVGLRKLLDRTQEVVGHGSSLRPPPFRAPPRLPGQGRGEPAPE